MRLQSLWEKHLSQVWLGFVLWMLLTATAVEASNQTSAEPDTGELHLGVKESITLGRVLLGMIMARLIFFLVNRLLHYVDRQYNRQLRPFHWQVINRLRLSQGKIRFMNQEDAEVIKTFIDGVPSE